MQNIIDTIDTFEEANTNALQNVLRNQFQQHFNFLVETIPSIEKIEFSFYRVEEDFCAMTDFFLIKDNGYTYHYGFESENEDISYWEFFKSQIAVIHAFIAYVSSCAYQCVTILGGGTLSFSKNSET